MTTLDDEIGEYLRAYRATREDVARRIPSAPAESVWRATWRRTEIELGLERQGVPVGPIEQWQGPPVVLET